MKSFFKSTFAIVSFYVGIYSVGMYVCNCAGYLYCVVPLLWKINEELFSILVNDVWKRKKVPWYFKAMLCVGM